MLVVAAVRANAGVARAATSAKAVINRVIVFSRVAGYIFLHRPIEVGRPASFVVSVRRLPSTCTRGRLAASGPVAAG